MAIVWKLSIINLDQKALLDGVILREEPFTYSGEIPSLKNLLKVSKSYFIPRFSNEKIEIYVGEHKIECSTDENGSFQEAIDHNLSGEVKVYAGSEPLEIIQDYPIFFNKTTGDFDVISDIDDTIMVSHTASNIKRLGTLAFLDPQERKVIPFAQKLFGEFTRKNARVIYVSKSESNLFNMIASIITINHLPQGALILTPYLKFKQLFSYEKGRDYKLNHIRFIVEHSANKKFVLMGDDSQRDMEVYAQIASAYPERVLRIYIRQTKTHRDKKHKNTWEKIKSTGVSARYFKSNEKVDDELKFYKS